MIFFLVFKNKLQTDKFLEYLNKKHRNIASTAEFEENNKIPFLDILITKNGGRIVTDVYRKDTYTGLGINFH